MSTPTADKAAVLKSLQNIARFWTERLATAKNDDDLVRISYDRARAAVKRAAAAGDTTAAHSLAETLAHWSADRERSAMKRHGL
ncbi:hypothetical protein [Streptomyces sp. NBC_01264]|uniref:hypothetical protein n=1 Tax=Streptomyces sp. NBC_01264 TaxID=2903804 RepID=UPI0022549590|nr:hypothetical protein [Streptomyces sp. NBC_01264]MCX4784645.1 hypothetical protein [Streptomyces sp. NBC_01264]